MPSTVPVAVRSTCSGLPCAGLRPLAPSSDRASCRRGTRAREAEVRHAHAPVAADQHVVGLEVAVEQADRVRGDAGRAPPGGTRRGSRATCAATCLSQRRQRVALDELHRDVDVAVVGRADVVDADDVGVVELRDRLRLALEPRARFLGVRRRGSRAGA